jgi:hypothetical protein
VKSTDSVPLDVKRRRPPSEGDRDLRGRGPSAFVNKTPPRLNRQTAAFVRTALPNRRLPWRQGGAAPGRASMMERPTLRRCVPPSKYWNAAIRFCSRRVWVRSAEATLFCQPVMPPARAAPPRTPPTPISAVTTALDTARRLASQPAIAGLWISFRATTEPPDRPPRPERGLAAASSRPCSRGRDERFRDQQR